MRTTFADVARQFDAFMIDQFGVLLDGNGAYPQASETLAALAQAGKQVVLLSNSGKRAGPNEARLTKLGFDRASYRTVMSSGEAAFANIAARIGHDIAPQAAVWVHARDGDMSSVDGLALTLVGNTDRAEILIIAGSRADTFELEQYRSWLTPAAKRKVLAFCTNPDMEMLTPDGKRFGAGAIARLYEDLGGRVEWVGKPFPLIYIMAYDVLGQPDRARVLCIGDSPAHDIAGGQRAGFATALVRTGLHADLSDSQLMAHCTATAVPDFIIPSFTLMEP